MTLALEFPFLEAETIDEAIDTLTLFKSDAVLSVRPDNRLYYQHTGRSLQPILNQEKFTKLERDALYKAVGGIVLSTVKNFFEHGKTTEGRISHIVVDPKTAFGVFGPFDFEIMQKFNFQLKIQIYFTNFIFLKIQQMHKILLFVVSVIFCYKANSQTIDQRLISASQKTSYR